MEAGSSHHLIACWLPVLAVLCAGCGLGRHPLEGEPAPNLQLLDVQGSPHQLSDYFRKDTILVFWTDCVVCRAELPLVDSAVRQSGGRLQAVGISSREELPQVVTMAQQLGLGFPLLLDPGGRAQQVYQVVTLPTAFRIEPSGRIAEVRIGGAGYELTWKQRERLEQPGVSP